MMLGRVFHQLELVLDAPEDLRQLGRSLLERQLAPPDPRDR